MIESCVNERWYIAIEFEEYNNARFNHRFENIWCSDGDKRAKQYMRKLYGKDWRKRFELYRIAKEL